MQPSHEAVHAGTASQVTAHDVPLPHDVTHAEASVGASGHFAGGHAQPHPEHVYPHVDPSQAAEGHVFGSGGGDGDVHGTYGASLEGPPSPGRASDDASRRASGSVKRSWKSSWHAAIGVAATTTVTTHAATNRTCPRLPHGGRMAAMRAALTLTLALVAAEAAVLAPRVARAADPAGEAASNEKEATRLFLKGSKLFVARRYAEALDDLRASYRLVPSPNSALLVARCLRALGRPVEAAATYASVEADATRRAGEDASYAHTAAAAASEGAQVRATLGSVSVHVARARPHTRVDVDGEPVTLDDTTRSALVWHEPGTANVRVVSPSGAEEVRAVAVRAGGDARVELDGDVRAPGERSEEPASGGPPPSSAQTTTPPPGRAPAPTPPPNGEGAPESAASRTSADWTLPAAGIAGGVALVGIAVFAGFGASSHSTYENLRDRCGPHACGDAERADADLGMKNQRIANAGLVVGLVGAAAAGTLLVVHFASGRAPTSAAIGVRGAGIVAELTTP